MPSRIPNRDELMSSIGYMNESTNQRVRGAEAQRLRSEGYPTNVCACADCVRQWDANTMQTPIRQGGAARVFEQLVFDNGIAAEQGSPPWFYRGGDTNGRSRTIGRWIAPRTRQPRGWAFTTLQAFRNRMTPRYDRQTYRTVTHPTPLARPWGGYVGDRDTPEQRAGRTWFGPELPGRARELRGHLMYPSNAPPDRRIVATREANAARVAALEALNEHQARMVSRAALDSTPIWTATTSGTWTSGGTVLQAQPVTFDPANAPIEAPILADEPGHLVAEEGESPYAFEHRRWMHRNGALPEDLEGYVSPWVNQPLPEDASERSVEIRANDEMAEQRWYMENRIAVRRRELMEREAEAAREIAAEARRQDRVERSQRRASSGATERLLSEEQRAVVEQPLRNLLGKGGRVWSAEVECNILSPGEAAEALDCATGQYSTRPDKPSVVATSDSTVDAEVKVSCMRDGARKHAEFAASVYDRLRAAGSEIRPNCGHHVHIDGTRIADQGADVALQVTWAASQLARMCERTLIKLASSGFDAHRQYGATRAFAVDIGQVRSKSSALHGGRLLQAAAGRNLDYSGATIEYRAPNGTLEPLRAHAYIATALSLVDAAERAVLDQEPAAVRALELANEQLGHGAGLNEVLGAEFLVEHMAFSDDSFMALLVSAYTSPATAGHRLVWRNRAPQSVTDALLAQRGA